MLKGIDSVGGGYQIQQLPRRRLVDADLELHAMADVLDCCVKGAGDRPPLCLAMDCHGSFHKVHDMLLGILPLSEFCDLPMLKNCHLSSSSLRVPCFPFRHLVYKDEDRPMFPCLDPKHILKAVSRSLRSSARTLGMCLLLLWMFVTVFITFITVYIIC